MISMLKCSVLYQATEFLTRMARDTKAQGSWYLAKAKGFGDKAVRISGSADTRQRSFACPAFKHPQSRVKGNKTRCKGSMWRFSSLHVHGKSTSGLVLKYPLLPSRNSTQRLSSNLHRLVTNSSGFSIQYGGIRPYHHGPNFNSARNLGTLKELVSSDAQRRTIYALSTPPGKAGVAVIRISGPDALNVWNAMIKPYTSTKRQKSRPEPWKLERCRVTDPKTADVLDDGLAVFFKGRHP